MPVLFPDNMEPEVIPTVKVKVEPTLQETSETSYPCDSCDATFTSVPSLQEHLKTHVLSTRPYECPECGKRFTTNSGLKQHHNIHSSVKPFQCEVCLKAYTQFSNLCRHKRNHPECRQSLHIGDRTLCVACGADFNSMTSLAKHQRYCAEKKPESEVVPQIPRMPFAPYAMFPAMMPMQAFPPTFLVNRPQLSPNSSASDIEETESRPIDQSPRVDVKRERPDVPIVKPITFDPKFITWSPQKQEQPFDLSKRAMTPLKIQTEDQPLDLSMKKPVKEPKESQPSPSISEPSSSLSQPSPVQPSSPSPPLREEPAQKTPVATPSKYLSPEKADETVEDLRNRHLRAMNRMLQQYSPMKSPAKFADRISPNVVVSPSMMVSKASPSMVSPNVVVSPSMILSKASPSMVSPSTSQSRISPVLSPATPIKVSLTSPLPTKTMGTNYSQSEPRSKSYHPCNYCGKVFPRGANLNRHLRTHTGEKPFQCELCNRQFSIGSNLKRHIQNVHDKCRVQCQICEKTFGDKSNLDRHLEVKHRVSRPSESRTQSPELPTMVALQRATPSETTEEPTTLKQEPVKAEMPEPSEPESMETESSDLAQRSESPENKRDDNNNNNSVSQDKSLTIRDIYPNFPESDDEDALVIDI